VWPSRYRSREARKDIAAWIAAANSDDVLSAFLWAVEGHFVKEALDGVNGEVKWIEDVRDELADLQRSSKPFDLEWQYTRREIDTAMRSLMVTVAQALKRCREIATKVSENFRELADRFGMPPGDCFQAALDGESPTQSAYNQMDECLKLTDELKRTIKEFKATQATVRDIDSRRAAFASSNNSIDDRELQRCDGSGFEEITAWVLQRDGLTILRRGGGARDHGADIIALTPAGRRVVVQCKFRQGKPIGPDVVYQVNGTARPFHKADIPIIVTTTSFSAQATEFALSQDIYLVDEWRLRKWATWGESIFDVLGIAEPVEGNDPAVEPGAA
jgi:restriction system protein